jgi:hypothetical protein
MPHLIAISDLLIVGTLFTVWLALRRAGMIGIASVIVAGALLVVLAWAASWTWWPPLASQRLVPGLRGQPLAILSVVAGFTALLALPTVRHLLREADLSWLATMGFWRILYGILLLTLGLQGQLPPAFFWSTAFGDMAVGLWGLAILARRRDVKTGEFAAWNIVGLVDLAHVLAVGSATLRPFYLANPVIVPLNLLPMAGVPVFIALHIMTLYGLFTRQSRALHA